jgi:hypothetical protein
MLNYVSIILMPYIQANPYVQAKPSQCISCRTKPNHFMPIEAIPNRSPILSQPKSNPFPTEVQSSPIIQHFRSWCTLERIVSPYHPCMRYSPGLDRKFLPVLMTVNIFAKTLPTHAVAE